MAYSTNYRKYTFIEFYELAKRRVWPGGNVIGVGFVDKGAQLPHNIKHKVDCCNRIDIVDVARGLNMGAGIASIMAGSIEHGNYGSVSFMSKQGFYPGYYNYKDNLRGGWKGGGSRGVKTHQLSGSKGIAANLGKKIFFVGVALNSIIVVDSYLDRNNRADGNSVLVRSSLDTLMSYIGTFGGIVGFVVSGAYFIISSSSSASNDLSSNSDSNYAAKDNTAFRNPVKDKKAQLDRIEISKRNEEQKNRKNPVFKPGRR